MGGGEGDGTNSDKEDSDIIESSKTYDAQNGETNSNNSSEDSEGVGKSRGGQGVGLHGLQVGSNKEVGQEENKMKKTTKMIEGRTKDRK